MGLLKKIFVREQKENIPDEWKSLEKTRQELFNKAVEFVNKED